MPAFLNALRDEVVTLVGATWTDVAANGIYRMQELARIPWERVTLPVAIVNMDPTPTGAWGLDVQADSVATSIFRIMPDAATAYSGATPDNLYTKLEAMRNAIWPSNPFANGFVVERPVATDIMSLPMNEWLVSTGRSGYAGVVIATFIHADR